MKQSDCLEIIKEVVYDIIYNTLCRAGMHLILYTFASCVHRKTNGLEAIKTRREKADSRSL